MAATLSTETTYSPAEAARILGVSKLTLADWRSQGLGPIYVKTSPARHGRVIYLGADLSAFLDQRRMVRATQAA